MTGQKKLNGRVMLGDQTGRTIGFRTANFDPSVIASENVMPGVYASTVTVRGKRYKGLLYLGPRLVKGETHHVLEIHILGFHDDIYGENVTFTVGKYIRGVLQFNSLTDLKRQIEKDIDAVTAS